MKWFQYFLFLLPFVLALPSNAQTVYLPQQFDFRWEQDQWLKQNELGTRHSGIRQPGISSANDSAMLSWYMSKYSRTTKQSLFGRKVFNEHLIRFNKKDVLIWIDPLMNFQGGLDLEDTSSSALYTNTRGVQVQGYITKKVSFYSSFYENQSFFPAYVDSAIFASGVVPGMGSRKPFGDGGHDYNMATGWVRLQPIEYLGLQFGHNKLFIGEGYRSVLLSDNAFNYPSLELDVSLFNNKLFYQLNYAILQDEESTNLQPNTDAIRKRKLANIRYLSFKPIPELEIGLSEIVMWQRWDDSTGTLDYEPLYLNPIPLISSFVDVDSLNQGYIGLNLSYTFKHRYVGYGQLLYSNEEFSGFQIGAKAFDALGVNGLYIHGEYNATEVEAYGYGSSQTELYQMGQPLGFVQGSDATELIGTIRYTYRGLFAQARIQQIERQGQAIQILSGEGGYLINPRYNLNLYGGAMLRNADGQSPTQWFYAGIRTSIINMYLDF